MGRAELTGEPRIRLGAILESGVAELPEETGAGAGVDPRPTDSETSHTASVRTLHGPSICLYDLQDLLVGGLEYHL
jgi:hypothetical protein